MHYNGANSYLLVNGTEIIKFKAKDSEIAATPLFLGNISKDFSNGNKNYIFYSNDFFSCSQLNVNPLKCVSMNNQESKIRKK